MSSRWPDGGPKSIALLGLLYCAGCPGSRAPAEAPSSDGALAANAPRTATGEFISWREHIVDDPAVGGVPIAGGDGLAIADLDRDGYRDIVSVHESDTQYDGNADGHVRIAFGAARPDAWERATLAAGAEAGAAEDVAVGDLNADGHPDVVVACELAHLIYFENPGKLARTARWERVIPTATTGRGSFIRVALADFDGDGRLEVAAANKGAQDPGPNDNDPKPISVFEIAGDPADPSAWTEHVLGRVAVPINVHVVDLDADGDPDVLAGSRNELRILWFENTSTDALAFVEHAIEISGTAIPDNERPPELRGTGRALVTGFNVDSADLDGNGRVDIVLAEGSDRLVWLAHPEKPSLPWPLRAIGSIRPDTLAGLALGDIDGDGDSDAIVGGYSMGPRDQDGAVKASDPLGRLAWFEQRDGSWVRHEISRRKRGMFDEFVALDLDADGDIDFASTRGNSARFDGVFWLEQVRTRDPAPVFERARAQDSDEVPLPHPGGPQTSP